MKTPNPSSRAPMRGFTMIEVMIVVAIVGVLAAIALPSYLDQQRKSRRASAQAHLINVASKEQQYLMDQRTYVGAGSCDATGLATLNTPTPADVAAFYDVCVTSAAGPPPTFTVQATPKAGGSQTGDLGGAVLSVDNGGVKLPATYGGNPVW